MTESAEGSQVRADLQTALSFNDVTAFDHSGAQTTLVNNTGYYRVFGNVSAISTSSATKNGRFELNNGVTDRQIVEYKMNTNSNTTNVMIPFDFIVFLPAGHSLIASTTDSNIVLAGCTKQIADVNGVLTQPS